MDAKRLSWSLRHELTHWKARDPWANALRRLFQILFFFHPAAWWAGKQWKEAMELACDRALVRSEHDVTEYVEELYALLTAVQHRRRLGLAGGLFATRTQLGRRIATLLTTPLRFSGRLSRGALAGLAIFAVACFSLGARFAPAETGVTADADVPGETVSGCVKDGDGVPIAGARVVWLKGARAVRGSRMESPCFPGKTAAFPCPSKTATRK